MFLKNKKNKERGVQMRCLLSQMFQTCHVIFPIIVIIYKSSSQKAKRFCLLSENVSAISASARVCMYVNMKQDQTKKVQLFCGHGVTNKLLKILFCHRLHTKLQMSTWKGRICHLFCLLLEHLKMHLLFYFATDLDVRKRLS